MKPNDLKTAGRFLLRLPEEKNHLWLNKTGRISSPQQKFFKKLMKMEDYSLNCFAIAGLNLADTFHMHLTLHTWLVLLTCMVLFIHVDMSIYLGVYRSEFKL